MHLFERNQNNNVFFDQILKIRSTSNGCRIARTNNALRFFQKNIQLLLLNRKKNRFPYRRFLLGTNFFKINLIDHDDMVLNFTKSRHFRISTEIKPKTDEFRPFFVKLVKIPLNFFHYSPK